jgi:hypothetical protein
MTEHLHFTKDYLHSSNRRAKRQQALKEGKEYQRGDIVFWKAPGKAFAAYKILNFISAPEGVTIVLEGVEGPEDEYESYGTKKNQILLKADLDRYSQGQSADISKKLMHLANNFFGEQTIHVGTLTSSSSSFEKHIHVSTVDALYAEFNRSIAAFYERGDFEALYNVLDEMYEHQRLRILHGNGIELPETFGEDDFCEQLERIKLRVKNVLEDTQPRGEIPTPLINPSKLRVITEITTLVEQLKAWERDLAQAT